jgi:agmatine deiminase
LRISRRKFLQLSAPLGGYVLLPAFTKKILASTNAEQWFMPDEGKRHMRTWMSFIASHDIWTGKQVPAVQQNLASIAKTIAKYEPVSMLVQKKDYHIALQLLGGLNTHNYPIKLLIFKMNDLWTRDTAPVFVVNKQGQKAAVNFNFNGWGEDQDYELDAKIADFITMQAQVQSIHTPLILEGGCFEVDGNGTAIMTESCILNSNRNPNFEKTQVEAELKALLGLEKIIWLKGIKGKDITDGHTDFYARFARPGLVVVSRDIDKASYDYKITRENIRILQSSLDAQGHHLKVVILDTPWNINQQYGTSEFAAGYVGFYVCNGAVIMQKFGDKNADKRARNQLAEVFQNHHIEQIAIDGIASGGGSIHCTTQQEPEV